VRETLFSWLEEFIDSFGEESAELDSGIGADPIRWDGVEALEH